MFMYMYMYIYVHIYTYIYVHSHAKIVTDRIYKYVELGIYISLCILYICSYYVRHFPVLHHGGGLPTPPQQ